MPEHRVNLSNKKCSKYDVLHGRDDINSSSYGSGFLVYIPIYDRGYSNLILPPLAYQLYRVKITNHYITPHIKIDNGWF